MSASREERLSPPVWRPRRPSLVSASGRDHIAQDLAGNRANFQSPSGVDRTSAASSWHRGMSASREERLSLPVWRPHRLSIVSASGRDHIAIDLAGNRTNFQSPSGVDRTSAASSGAEGRARRLRRGASPPELRLAREAGPQPGGAPWRLHFCCNRPSSASPSTWPRVMAQRAQRFASGVASVLAELRLAERSRPRPRASAALSWRRELSVSPPARRLSPPSSARKGGGTASGRSALAVSHLMQTYHLS